MPVDLPDVDRPARTAPRTVDIEPWREACKLGAEGIVSKRLGSTYRSGRIDAWVKVKNPDVAAVQRDRAANWKKVGRSALKDGSSKRLQHATQLSPGDAAQRNTSANPRVSPMRMLSLRWSSPAPRRGNHADFLVCLLRWFRSGAACRDALMRSRSTLAPSSFGSCGTNSPRNALARTAWSRWSINLRALVVSAARRSIHAKAVLIRLTISSRSSGGATGMRSRFRSIR